ncbi:23S rRNA (guanosine-2'-O-)-methyltransferase RlmB [Spiroplasma sp. JKS002671]|uniref:TrmH family RNA methyltransferase n=1 Tax=Spiroplasma attinicola TaxID=2904537 RepID=UPI002022B3D4|nr:RNA methyltransferase [Spiroplasma sp. JKS002671]MCL8210506.1 23S rRNA (guanosine-2'-O-)-methyltransferase RlmB [Spiroplasma sp. JKS002671]
MKEITAVNNPLIQYLRTLQKSKNRYQNHQFLVEGWHLVEKALEAEVVLTVFILNNQLDNYQNKLPKNIKIILINQAIIKKISQEVTPQGIIALCKFKVVTEKSPNNVLLLDKIQDPSNLGAILRSCSAFGINKIFLSNDSVDLYNHKVINASQGAIFNVSVEYCDLISLIVKLKKENYYLYGTFLHETNKPKTLETIKFQAKNAILFGNEGKGINQDLRNLVDENILIKTTNNVESLNLATSVAITIYSLFITNKLS